MGGGGLVAMAGKRLVATVGQGIATLHEIPVFVTLQKYYGEMKFLGATVAMTSAIVGLNKHYFEVTFSRLEFEPKTQLCPMNTKLDAFLILANDVKQDMIGLKADVRGLNVDVCGLKADVGGLKADIVAMNKKLDDIGNKLDAMTHKK